MFPTGGGFVSMSDATSDANVVSLAAFDALFDEVKNWGRWGPNDQLGTLNLITPEKVRAARASSGRGTLMECDQQGGGSTTAPGDPLVSQRHRHRLERLRFA
jgi:hypothetical protein